MLVFAVIAESFAVIGQQNDRRFVVDPFLPQKIEKTAHDRVGSDDVGIVRRLVRRMWLVDVKKEKERLRLVLADPLLRDLASLVAGSLCSSQAEKIGIEVDVVAPKIEAATDPSF